MLLTFENNQFVIRSLSETQLFSLIKGQLKDLWLRNHADNSFRTKNILEAARFRKYADNKTENIFQKLMLKVYPLPSSGPICPDGLELMPFQKEKGIPFILSGSRRYLAHQPGLGKSAQAICAVNTKPGRALIICPSFLKTTWAREITKWAVNFPSIAVVPESHRQNEMNWKADFVICSDSMLLKEWVRHNIYRTEFRHIYIDEGHRFQTPGASRTTALFGGVVPDAKGKAKLRSPGLIYNSDHVTVLSGTPMLGTPIELWPILYAMAPEVIDFMPYQDFGFRYCGAFTDERGHWHFTGSSNEGELNNRLMGRFMQRLTKNDVLHDLPDKIREVVVMDEDPRSAKVLRMEREALKELDGARVDKPERLEEYAVLRHELGLAKVDWVSRFVAGYLESDPNEQIILFAYHRDVVALLAERLSNFNPMVINGGVSNEKRTEFEDLFQSKKRRLIIGNIDAMNLGLTLTAAKRVVFCEVSYTPANNEQAEDRAHRIGQKDSVFVQYVVMPNSFDEISLNIILRKESSIRKVIG